MTTTRGRILRRAVLAASIVLLPLSGAVAAESLSQARTAMAQLIKSKEPDRPAFGRIDGRLIALGPADTAPFGALITYHDRQNCSIDVAACKTELYVLRAGVWTRVATFATQSPGDVTVADTANRGFSDLRFVVLMPPAATRRANVWLRWNGNRYVEHRRVLR